MAANNNANLQAALAASRQAYNEQAAENEALATLASGESANQNLLEDMIMQMTGMAGNPGARKRLIAIAAADTAMKYGAPKNATRSLIDSLQEKLYSEIPIEISPEYQAAKEYISDFTEEPILQRLQEIDAEMTAQEQRNEAAQRNRIQAQLRSLANQRAAEEAAAAKAEANRIAALNAARRARWGGPSTGPKKNGNGAKSRKGRKATRRERKSRKGRKTFRK